MDINPVSLSSGQQYMWVSDYYDNTGLSEFYLDPLDDTIKKNNIESINKSILNKFGLVGHGLKLYYDVLGGTFFVRDKVLSFRIIDDTNNMTYNISGSSKFYYNDLIIYKQGMSVANTGNLNNSTNIISGYYFGFKGKPQFDSGIVFNYKNIFCLELNKPIYFDITLSSSKEFIGKLELLVNNKVTHSTPVIFEKPNISYNIKYPLVLA